ncbi:alpha/beta hydrolase [Pseudonocardiaceae bacterium YIM PH 21723]|nr:alpha/beta hydrolase [Pseudonocardiaceae bacterium YIM PH 21723]
MSGLLGTFVGIVSGLYSRELRSAIELSARHLRFTSTLTVVLISTIVTSISSIMFYRLIIRRRWNGSITRGEIFIKSDAVVNLTSDRDSVVGRRLAYLEAKRPGDDLVVFLHGLGLDAHDFRPYMLESKFHCISLTMFGFNVEERGDEHYGPISLDSHINLLMYALERFSQRYGGKRLTLVGFSFGADMALFLSKVKPEALARLHIRKAVLLDPNVNRSTTTISSKISRVDQEQPLAQLVAILESAGNVAEFRYLSEYLYKITSKNFAQIQRHAREVVDEWPDDTYDRFLDLLGRLMGLSAGVHVVLSFNYESLFNGLARGAVARGLDTSDLECSTYDHFELISPAHLKERLEGLL